MGATRSRRAARAAIDPQRLLDAVPAAIVYIDRRPRILAASRAYERLLGMTREALVGRTPAEVLGPRTWALVQPWLERALGGETVHFERPLPTDSGLRRDLMVEYVPDTGPRGAVRGVFGIVTDVTELRAAQRDAEHREAQLQGIFDLGLIGVAATGADGARLWFNDRLCEIYGRSRAMLERTTWRDLTHPDDLAEDIRQTARLRTGEIEGYQRDKRLLRADGEVIHARVVVRAVRTPTGAFDHSVTLVHDISELRRAEMAALATAEQHRLAAEAAQVYPWHWEIASDTLDWMHPPEGVLGPRPGTGRYPPFAQMVHAQDRPRFLEGRRRAMAARGDHRDELRIVRSDGAVRWVLTRGQAYGDETGAPTRMAGVLVDVHERKLAEQALAASEARFRSLTELSGDWYWEQDAELRFVETEGPNAQRAGITAGDHLGRRRWELPRTEIVGGDWGPHRRDLEARRPFRDLLLQRTGPDGGVHYVRVAGTPIHDAAGGFTGYRGVATDVTGAVTLERRNADLANAIENASIEMCLCDAEDRIVLANRAFREGNGERAAFLAPGLPYADYLRAGLRMGLPAAARGREDTWLAERLARRRAGDAIFEQQMLDDKWLLVNEHRLPDGSTLTTGMDISDRKRTALALAASESRFRDFAAASGEWFWETDADGHYTWFSEEVERTTGFPREWHYGKSRAELAASAGAELTAEPWRSHLDTMRRHEPFRDFRFMRRAPDGIRWIASSGVPRFGEDGAFLGYRGTGTDITRQMMLEQRARAADERLKLAIEDLNEPICLTDPQGGIVMANRAFRRINANVAAHLAPGTPYEAHLRAGLAAGNYPDATGQADQWLAERLAQRRAGGGPIEQRRSDGLLLVGYDQRFPDGSVLTYSMDVTDRRRAEDELRALTETLEQRVAERTAALEDAVRELEAFSYSVSHDLRAPLRAINGYARILADDEGPRISEDGQRHLKSIERNANRMGELVDDLLDLARVNRADLRRRRLDLGALARSVADELSAHYPKARVEIGRLPMAEGDPVLLRQVLANLVGNALKYSARREGEARVRIDWDNATAACCVTDNGVGFDMAHAGKLFGTFERLHTAGEFEGTGIGLAIVKRIVERHGGRVWAEAVLNEGAAFRFTLA